MNTLEIDTLLKNHPHSRPVFKGVYVRNRLPRLLNVPSTLVGNTGSLYTSTPTQEGNTTTPTGRPPFLRAYVNFMNKHYTSWIYNTIRVQEEGSTVCVHHCIFYLINRCAGHSMTEVTRLLENPVEATDNVQKCVLLLVKHVL